MAEELGEKTEQPTGKRIFEARDGGSVAKSADLGAALELVCALILLLTLGPALFAGLAGMVRYLLDARASGAALTGDESNIILCIKWALWHVSMLVLPFFAVLFAVVFMGQLYQAGWHPTLTPLMPKFDRLNPVGGVKRLFSTQNLFKSGLSLLKLALFIVICWKILYSEWRHITLLPQLDMRPMLGELLNIIRRVCIWLITVLAILGVVDYLYQKWKFTDGMKMTKQEVKEEQKAVEGDQQIKSRRFKQARAAAMQRMRQAVPKANVVVTNPTHYAVALRYDAGSMAAPIVVAKGTDFLAMRIREVAAANGVPILERPPLARALYAGVPVGRPIKPEYYEAVAEILAYVYRMENKAA